MGVRVHVPHAVFNTAQPPTPPWGVLDSGLQAAHLLTLEVWVRIYRVDRDCLRLDLAAGNQDDFVYSLWVSRLLWEFELIGVCFCLGFSCLAIIAKSHRLFDTWMKTHKLNCVGILSKGIIVDLLLTLQTSPGPIQSSSELSLEKSYNDQY